MPNKIKPEQVPKECLVAYQRAFKAGGGPADGIAAALSAWPGVKFEHLSGWVMDGPDLPYVEETASIILPLQTQENGNE